MSRPPNAVDDDVWQAEVADVDKLGHLKRARHPRRHPIQPPEGVYQQPSLPPRVNPIAILSNTAGCQSGKADNIPHSLLKDIAFGKFPPTAMLDLHGLREGDAWLKLTNWLHQAFEHEHRCVLIITGKGKGYGVEGDMGLLKAQTPQWLAAHPRVQAFHSAQPKDGGTGAVYVYLQRRRL